MTTYVNSGIKLIEKASTWTQLQIMFSRAWKLNARNKLIAKVV